MWFRGRGRLSHSGMHLHVGRLSERLERQPGPEDKLEEGRQGRGEPAGAPALRDGRHRRQEAERGTRRLISAGAAKTNVTGATGENRSFLN